MAINAVISLFAFEQVLFVVVFHGYRKYLTRIEMLYRDGPDQPVRAA